MCDEEFNTLISISNKMRKRIFNDLKCTLLTDPRNDQRRRKTDDITMCWLCTQSIFLQRQDNVHASLLYPRLITMAKTSLTPTRLNPRMLELTAALFNNILPDARHF